MAAVLVVDDEQAILDLLVDIIEEAGHTPLTARDGFEALACIYQQRPALIISDIMMPRMDGHTLVRALLDDTALVQIPVILMSAGTALVGTPSNVIGFLPKPFDLDVVDALVQRLA